MSILAGRHPGNTDRVVIAGNTVTRQSSLVDQATDDCSPAASCILSTRGTSNTLYLARSGIYLQGPVLPRIPAAASRATGEP